MTGITLFALMLARLADEGLLTFHHDQAAWSWDADRIRAKGYTDNVADLMEGKLRRLPEDTRSALQQLACLGDGADVRTLSELLELKRLLDQVR